ncbi:MAG TPA: hypothetical protein VF544_03520 [Pyrinomonadaceae bacterium]|jgi:hypothetical protein
MAEVDVLIVVDVEGATTGQGGLANNVWMIDSGKYTGTQECGNELITNLKSTDQVTWTVQPIDPGTNVQFAAPTPQNPTWPFTGQAVTAPAVINPKQNPVMPSQYMAIFTPPAGTAANTQYQYSIVLSMEGQIQTFDPFLNLFQAN